MRISFDLDETIICYGDQVPREPSLPWYRRLFVRDEPLRQGTSQLTRQLQDEGWEVWIYTTSYRDPRSIRRWLRWHGVHVSGVINQELHEAHLRRTPMDHTPTKNPAAFEIDLHVDDSEGVFLEGQKYGFQVIVISPHDIAWTDRVLAIAHAQIMRPTT